MLELAFFTKKQGSSRVFQTRSHLLINITLSVRATNCRNYLIYILPLEMQDSDEVWVARDIMMISLGTVTLLSVAFIEPFVIVDGSLGSVGS